MTCRAWFTLVAHRLYRELFVPSTRVYEIMRDLGKPGSHIANFAEEVTIRGVFPWGTLPRLVAMLPHLKGLSILRSHASVATNEYGPRLPDRYSVTRHALAPCMDMDSLTLSGLWFASTADVLLVFAEFPRLAHATIERCKIAKASATARPMFLTKLNVENWRAPNGVVAYLALQWQNPRANTVCSSNIFPGLCRDDAREVVVALTAITYSLDPATS